MEPIFIDDYEKREWLGRQALKELRSLYPDTFKYNIEFTSGKYDDYDAFYFILDKDNKLSKYVWIEIKVRKGTFTSYFLEKEKLDRMEAQRERLYLNKDEVIFLYLNFCPEGTYCWNITNIDDGIWEKRLMNVSTSRNSKDKEMKEIKYLEPVKSKQFDYILNEKQLLRNYKLDYLLPKIEEKIKKQNGLNFLFD